MPQSIPAVPIPPPLFCLSQGSGISVPQAIWQSRDFHVAALSLPFSESPSDKDVKFVINFV